MCNTTKAKMLALVSSSCQGVAEVVCALVMLQGVLNGAIVFERKCPWHRNATRVFVERVFQEEATVSPAREVAERDLTQCTTQLFILAQQSLMKQSKDSPECANFIRSTHHNCLQLIHSGLLPNTHSFS